VIVAAATEVDAFRERIRDAAAARPPLRIVGAGTWLDAGQPLAGTMSDTLSTRGLGGIVEYVPGDLTLTARAGTSLAEIRAVTAPEGQWLALDPHGADEGTIGATVATASVGPLATAFGTPRDLVLGVEVVTGTAAIVRGGGRVVKNVAGFDLTRLVTGSWGTLGVITEVTVRLHARPEVDLSLAIRLPARGDAVDAVRLLLRKAPFTPHACELVNDALARQLGIGDRATVIVRVSGNAEAVKAQRDLLGQIAEPREVSSDVWTRLRAADSANGATLVFRLSQLPSRLEDIWRAAMAVAAAAPDTLVHATAMRGVVRCIVPASAHEGDVGPVLTGQSTRTCVGERLPPSLWQTLNSAVQRDGGVARLARGIKAAFDPARVLNPGILGEPL